jgi:quercetin dioxygenase-like cupin family protein
MDLNVIVPVLLFVLLSPGVLLSLPPGQPHTVQVVTHALVFGLVYYGLRKVFPQYY